MTANEFCKNAEGLIGEPYSETDCIGVVRKSAKIRCQGTNWLWRSFNASGKYRYLTERSERGPSIMELMDGMLVFRIDKNAIPKGYSDKPNCHHVGIIIGNDVIQSQDGKGVYRKRYYENEWNGWGWLRQIDKPSPNQSDNDDLPFTDLPESDLYYSNLSDHEMLTRIYRKIVLGESID